VPPITGTGADALRRAEAWVQRALRGQTFDGPRVFVHPIGADLLKHQRERAAADPVSFAEEHATYEVVRRLFTQSLRTPNLDDADYVFVPLHAAVFESDGPWQLGDIVDHLSTLDSGKPHIVCSIADYHPRRPGTHANPFSVPGDPKNPWCERYTDEYDWLDDRFVWLSPESTVDLAPQDIGMPVVIPKAPIRPSGRKRPLRFSFAGRTTYTRVRPGHVRGSETIPAWQRLEALNKTGTSFVGSSETLVQTMGPQSTVRRLPERSVFSLCPAGWGRWTFRLFEALLAGSIPVILSDYYLKPFSERVPWDRFTLTIPEADLFRIDQVLANVSDARILSMQQHLEHNQHHFTPAGIARLLAARLADDARFSPWSR
jgi:hypothetical protein